MVIADLVNIMVYVQSSVHFGPLSRHRPSLWDLSLVSHAHGDSLRSYTCVRLPSWELKCPAFLFTRRRPSHLQMGGTLANFSRNKTDYPDPRQTQSLQLRIVSGNLTDFHSHASPSSS